MLLDMRVLELLSSKLCHDLISPVSAINNGVELIEDIGGSVVDEAMSLIGNSATCAARRLKLFRIAYGRAGSEEGLSFRDAKVVADQYMQGGKTKLVWSEDSGIEDSFNHKGFMKVVLNLLVMSEEILAYGGTVTLRNVAEGAGRGVSLEIVGRNAQVTPQIDAALKGTAEIDDLTPRSIQAYVTGRFAEYFEFGLECEQPHLDCLILSLRVNETVTSV